MGTSKWFAKNCENWSIYMDQKKELTVTKEIAIIDENSLKSRIFTIRGIKVMLDSDLAELYGYSTKRFNEQVKNNIEKFDEDFRFQVTKEEYREILRSKKSTLEQGKYSKFLPYAFTEQGIYMLISVLKGDLAVRQSKSIIRLFKKMKDYIVTENRQLLGYTDVVQIVSQVSPTRAEFNNLASDVRKVMENFDDPTTYKHFLILNGQKLEADIAYTQIYSMAKKSIIIVDDYVGIKTLDLLRGIAKHVSVKIYSDEKGPEQLTEQMLNDFRAVRQDVTISVDRTRNKFHDRYVFLDYDCPNEKLFHCGASSKDAGNKITTIMHIECPQVYHAMIEGLIGKKT